jgi:energy-coupling factor transport system ATP-binding protein
MSKQANEFISVKNLSFSYQGTEKTAIANINLQVKKGEFLGITGPTGAGKSTLLQCLNGVIPHFLAGRYEGEVYVAGRRVSETTSQELSGVIGTVFQDPEAQIVSANVEEELAFGPENLSLCPAEILKRIDFSLKAVGIEDLRHAAINSLSGGQKQRVAIAAVLAMLPEVIILDEPTAELDPVGTDDLFRALHELNRELGITVIIVEHKMEHLAQYCSRLLVLKDGRVQKDGKPSTVFADWQEVNELGVSLPQVTELIGRLLSEDGSRAIDEMPITIEEAKAYLKEVLSAEGKRRQV